MELLADKKFIPMKFKSIFRKSFLSNKLKSQIFIFDMILSLVILVVSLGVVLSYFVSTNQNTDIYDYNYEILSGFTETKINSLNSIEVRTMFVNNQIRNIDNTVAQQVCEFYNSGNILLAKNLTKIFVEDYVNKQMSFRVTYYNSTSSDILFEDIKNGMTQSDSGSISSVTQRTVFGFIDKDTMYGPDIIKIEIWM